MLTSNRLTFFDNLRVVLMAMVIIHHVGQAYGPTGGWWPVQELTRAEILGPFFMVNRSFGMSLFFMIAGYFTARSCNKNGPTGFMRSRLVRLGIPLLGFSLLMILLQVFLFGPLETGQLGPIWPIDVLHFWFVQHLLLYSLGYALWRMLRARSDQPLVSSSKPPGYTTILAFALALALATAIVRTWYDTDEWIYLFGYLRIAPTDVPRDLGLFLVGTLAYRKDWVSRFPSRAGHTWLILGLFLAGLWSVYELWLGELLVFSDTVWGLLFPMWESLLCCSMCIGLIVLFRDNMNAQGPIAKELAQSTYAAYMLHVFVVILFQYLALGLAISPLLKFFLVSLITVPVTFLMASMIRRSGRWLFRGQTQHATAGQAVGR